MENICGFFGDNRFLSNFYPCNVLYEDLHYPTAEHAYQAAKSVIPTERERIRKASTPGIAKRMGKALTLRKQWKRIKLHIMYEIVLAKFICNKDLMQSLMRTEDVYLEETNRWGDTYWGVCNNVGHNHMGHILMNIRSTLFYKGSKGEI